MYLLQRNALIRQHGKDVEGTITIGPWTLEMAAFNADDEKLLAEELEIPGVRVEDLVETEPKWVTMMLAVAGRTQP